MFVVSLNYVKALTEVDLHIADHIEYLKQYYAQKKFIVSGRKEPRTGGVILVKAMSRDELEDILSKDPFHVAGVAEYSITEFIPVMTAEGLDILKE